MMTVLMVCSLVCCVKPVQAPRPIQAPQVYSHPPHTTLPQSSRPTGEGWQWDNQGGYWWRRYESPLTFTYPTTMQSSQFPITNFNPTTIPVYYANPQPSTFSSPTFSLRRSNGVGVNCVGGG